MAVQSKFCAAFGIGAVLVGCMVSGCTVVDSLEGPEVAQDNSASRLQRAAIYACEDGEELSVAYDYDPPQVRVQRGDGAVHTLAADGESHAEVYRSTDPAMSFEAEMDQGVFSVGGVSKKCQGISRDLEPPTIERVTRDLRARDNGSEVVLGVGDMISISLVGVPTAGYEWTQANVPTFLKLVKETGGATTSAQYLPGYTGGNHWAVLVFEATGEGTGAVRLEERRPWEEDEPASDSFEVVVSAK